MPRVSLHSKQHQWCHSSERCAIVCGTEAEVQQYSSSYCAVWISAGSSSWSLICVSAEAAAPPSTLHARDMSPKIQIHLSNSRTSHPETHVFFLPLS